MAYAAVHDWLSRGSSDHAAGVALLFRHGAPSPAERFLFSLRPCPYTRRLLRLRLSELNTASTQELNASKPPVRVPPAVAERIAQEAHDRSMQQEAGMDITVGSLPPRLQPLRQDLKRMHDELKFLRGRLGLTPDGMLLRELADRITDLRKRINHGWSILETWRATGEVLISGAPSVDHAELMRERNTLRVRLSEHKHGRRTLSDEALAAKQHRLDEINTLLNGAPAQH